MRASQVLARRLFMRGMRAFVVKYVCVLFVGVGVGAGVVCVCVLVCCVEDRDTSKTIRIV